jgi:amidase
MLDFTSVVVPITFADENIDEPNNQFNPLTEIDRIVQAECKRNPFLRVEKF